MPIRQSQLQYKCFITSQPHSPIFIAFLGILSLLPSNVGRTRLKLVCMICAHLNFKASESSSSVTHIFLSYRPGFWYVGFNERVPRVGQRELLRDTWTMGSRVLWIILASFRMLPCLKKFCLKYVDCIVWLHIFPLQTSVNRWFSMSKGSVRSIIRAFNF